MAALTGEDIGWSLERWVQLKQAYVRAFPEPGRIRMIGDAPRVTFDRWLEHSAERIWQALTDNDELRTWFAATVEGSWEPGAAITLHSPDGAYQPASGRVGTVEPNRLLEYAWGEERLRFEIWDFGGNCRLLFVNDLEPGTDPNAARDVASAWHACLDQLGLLLEDRAEPRERMFAAAEEIRPRYDRAGEPVGTSGRSLLRLERVLGHSPARVWQAVTDPELIRQWLDPAEIELEPRVGGSVRVVYRGACHSSHHSVLGCYPTGPVCARFRWTDETRPVDRDQAERPVTGRPCCALARGVRCARTVARSGPTFRVTSGPITPGSDHVGPVMAMLLYEVAL